MLNNRAPSAPRMVGAQIKTERALGLRAQGLSYQKIADVMSQELGKRVDKKDCWDWVRRGLEQLNEEVKEAAEHVRQLQLDRLDEAMAAISDKVKAGNEKSIEIMLRIEERRAKLLGLDANFWPQDHTGKATAPGVVAEVPTERLEEALRLLSGEE